MVCAGIFRQRSVSTVLFVLHCAAREYHNYSILFLVM